MLDNDCLSGGACRDGRCVAPGATNPVGAQADAGTAVAEETVVRGQAFRHGWLEDSVESLPDEEALASLEAFVPLTDGGFEVRAVHRVGDAGFRVEDTPPGPLHLRMASRGHHIVVVTRERTVDLSQSVGGRAAGVDALGAGRLGVLTPRVQLAGVTPPANLWVTTPNTGFLGRLTLDGSGVDELEAYGGRLPDGTPKDRTFLWQTKPCGSDASWSYCEVAETAAVVEGVHLTSDAGVLAGALSPIPQTIISTTVRGQSFLPHADDVGATRDHVGAWVNVSAYPRPDPRSSELPDYYGSLLHASRPILAGETAIEVRFAYGVPVPPSWGRCFTFSATFVTDTLRLPGTSRGTVSSSILDSRPVSSVPATFLARISPPVDVRVDGAPAVEPGTFAHATPTIHWQPPRVGAASRYELTLDELRKEDDQTISQTTARIFTADTSVRLLPGTLTSGKTYYVEVSAVLTSASTVASTARPMVYGADYASADFVSAMWTAP